MAEEIAIRGSNEVGKIRGFGSILLLSIVTLGIYGIVYYYKLNKELADLGKARGTEELGTNPMLSVLAVTIGVVLFFIPPFVSLYGTWKRQDAARKMFNVQEGMDVVPGFLLSLFIGIVGTYFLAAGQNAVLRAQAQA
jgi:ethanolamine transporter EutH